MAPTRATISPSLSIGDVLNRKSSYCSPIAFVSELQVQEQSPRSSRIQHRKRQRSEAAETSKFDLRESFSHLQPIKVLVGTTVAELLVA
jgi:hypothetical protein